MSAATGSPSAIAMNGRSASRVAAQVKANAGAEVARHIEHQFESGAGTHRKLVIERFEGLAWLAIDRNDEGFRAVDRDRRQTRGRSAAETQPARGRRAGP